MGRDALEEEDTPKISFKSMATISSPIWDVVFKKVVGTEGGGARSGVA